MPVRLGSRAMDLLIALVDRAGTLVSGEQLMREVWPETHVVEGNLTVNMATLRRALRDGKDGRRYIVNTPGRGYYFVEPVKVVSCSGAHTIEVPHHNVPTRLTRLVGRDPMYCDLARQLTRERLATLSGPAGVGKSSAANAAAEILIPAHRDGVWWVDFGADTEPDQVTGAIAAVLGCDAKSSDLLDTLIAFLQDKQLLLVLDNCDRVIEGAASLAITLLKAAPLVRVLTTSREPLRIEGEYVHQVLPLAGPPADHSITQVQALRFPAVELFAERAATFGPYSFTDTEAPLVAEICRKLDGVPLAIELAAEHTDVFTAQAIAELVGKDLSLLSGKRRSNDARHQSMEAALDWSYALLTAEEAEVFRKLAMLACPFTLEAAAAYAQRKGQRMANILAELTKKSFLIAEFDGVVPRFRMLEMTRKYALQKLAESTTGATSSPRKLRLA